MVTAHIDNSLKINNTKERRYTLKVNTVFSKLYISVARSVVCGVIEDLISCAIT